MYFKLTRSQLKQLEPLFEQARQAGHEDQKGCILMQPFSEDDFLHPHNGECHVRFVEHKTAKKIVELLEAREAKAKRKPAPKRPVTP